MNKINEKTVNEFLDNMHMTFKEKNEKYGCSFETSLEKYGLIAALVRISDKFNRFEKLTMDKDIGTQDETIIDTLLDMANYCVMTAIYTQEHIKEHVQQETSQMSKKDCFGNYNGKSVDCKACDLIAACNVKKIKAELMKKC